MHPQHVESKALLKFPPGLRSLILNPGHNVLHLVLETAGARATWLAHRYVSAALEHTTGNVVLVTWAYGAQFWKQELRKSSNIDVDKSIQSHRLQIIDSDEVHNPTIVDNPTDSAKKWLSKITAVITQSSQQDTLLVLDSPDLLQGIEPISANVLSSMILELRTLVRNTVILASSNIFSTSSESTSPSPLQSQQQNLLVSLVHQADYVLAARVLDTGQASDVSGALRITRGGHISSIEDSQAVDLEFLYHVDAGRAARVWQRGAGR